MQSLIKKLEKFIYSKYKNEWIEADGVHIFVRKAQRFLPFPDRLENDRYYYSFDLANIVIEEKLRGQGRFKKLLAEIEQLARKHGFDCLYVESVLNNRLASFLTRSGWTQHPYIDPIAPCFYLRF